MANEYIFDEEFPEAAFQLDERAFEIFFRENFVSFCSFCRAKFGFDFEQAKEVVHNAFIKLWENRERLSSAVTLRPYMFRIITNSSLDVIKHEKMRQRYSKFFLATATEGFEETNMNNADFKKMAADVKSAIDELPEQMRMVFELSRNEGLKYAAIAAQLDISIKTVETQMSRALTRLRQKLERYLLILIAIITLVKFY
jgi:RNA polymerase sigma-70 factor (ECF subfamily)